MALITISRGIGCGGMIISRLVAEGLKLELYDDEKLQSEAIRMGIKPEAIKDMDEKALNQHCLKIEKAFHETCVLISAHIARENKIIEIMRHELEDKHISKST